jgi:hypothetical protein
VLHILNGFLGMLFSHLFYPLLFSAYFNLHTIDMIKSHSSE